METAGRRFAGGRSVWIKRKESEDGGQSFALEKRFKWDVHWKEDSSLCWSIRREERVDLFLDQNKSAQCRYAMKSGFIADISSWPTPTVSQQTKNTKKSLPGCERMPGFQLSRLFLVLNSICRRKTISRASRELENVFLSYSALHRLPAHK